jgi:hypothetical protein
VLFLREHIILATIHAVAKRRETAIRELFAAARGRIPLCEPQEQARLCVPSPDRLELPGRREMGRSSEQPLCQTDRAARCSCSVRTPLE